MALIPLADYRVCVGFECSWSKPTSSPFTASRLSVRRTLCLLVAACGLWAVAMGMTAWAAAASPVVPAGGKVAGKGYAYWLKLVVLRQLEHTAGAPCDTVTVGGERVAILSPNTNRSVSSITCDEPVGRPIYVVQLTYECSTLAGDHPGFGTTSAQLKKCAVVGAERAVYSASLDGQPIDLHKLVTATGVFFVPMVAGGSAPTARSAADGPGLLLRGPIKGTHTIRTTSGVPGVLPEQTVIYSVRIG